MTPDELQARTKQFTLRVMKLVEALPNSIVGWEFGRQLLRSSASVSANYRAARRARSRKEFVAKIGIVVEEIDESEHWLDLIIEGELLPEAKVEPLRTEAEELTHIFAKTQRTARKKKTKSPDRQIAKSPNTQENE